MLKRKLIATALAFLALPAFAHHGDSSQSDKVSSSHLAAYFAVFPSDTAGMAQVIVELEKVTVVNGVLTEEDLDQSKDDVVTISNGSSKVVYDPSSDNNLIPLVSKGAYNFTFKRFNGDKFHGTITLPDDVVISNPAQNSVFNNSTAVDVSWQAPTDPAYLAQVSLQWGGDCDPVGDATWTSDNSFQLPAGFASQCQGVTPVEIAVVFARDGEGYGLSQGITYSVVDFSYSSDASANKYGFKKALTKTMKHKLSHDDMVKILKSSHQGKRPALLINKQS